MTLPCLLSLSLSLANRDPMASIMGPAFTGEDDLAGMRDRIKLSGGSEEEQEARFKLLLMLNSYDQKLLRSSVKQMSEEVRLNMSSVTAEVDLLRGFAGLDEEKYTLESIDWESGTTLLCGRPSRFAESHTAHPQPLCYLFTAYTFSNGCRAPPWRQVNGDLAYIVAKPFDGDRLTIMANINGYWPIKGRVWEPCM